MTGTLAVLLVAAVSCGDLPYGPQDGTRQSPVRYDDSTAFEAELAALWLSGELEAPGELTEQIARELTLIRSNFSDSVPNSPIRYRSPLTPSTIYCFPDSSTFDSIKSGLYHAWDDLNVEYGLDSIIVHDEDWRTLLLVELRFEGIRHPARLAEAYCSLPGIPGVYDSGPRIVYWPTAIPYPVGGTANYIFYDPCKHWLLGCNNAAVDIFSMQEDGPRHDLHMEMGDSLPDEWKTLVWSARDCYFTGGQCCDTSHVELP